jgi:uncharacterized membrane protein
MNKKTLAIISYVTIIGWLIAYFSYKDSTDKSSFTRYHLKQSLGLGIAGLAYGVIINIIASIIPALLTILSLANLLIVVLWVLGIINASNEVEKPLPVVGNMFVDKFDFIK